MRQLLPAVHPVPALDVSGGGWEETQALMMMMMMMMMMNCLMSHGSLRNKTKLPADC